jgi:hypothetical protein
MSSRPPLKEALTTLSTSQNMAFVNARVTLESSRDLIRRRSSVTDHVLFHHMPYIVE